MTHIHHDFETYCELDVTKVGAFRYAQHPSCEPILLSWAVPDGEGDFTMYTWTPFAEPEVLQAIRDHMVVQAEEQGYAWKLLTGPKLPQRFVKLIEDDKVIFFAHNAEFEYCIWTYVMPRFGAPPIAAERFHCTATMSAASGLPRSLGKVGTALGLDIQKDKEGAKLLKVFCARKAALKPSKKNPDGVPPRRVFPIERAEDFAKFTGYNVTDVVTEIQVAEHVPELSRTEQKYYSLNIKMNTRGLPLDMLAVKKAMPLLTALENKVKDEMRELSGGVNPTQVPKLREFFNSIGIEVENLQAKTLKDYLLLHGDKLDDTAKRMLQLRVEGGKASTKKLKKMLEVVCDDGRVRGTFMFYGAHTGRWSGKLIQPQNFTRGEYKPWQQDQLFSFLYFGDPDIMELMYEWPIDAIAQGMRGFIKVPKGRKLVVSDFSAIEARVLAWLAQEVEVLKIYEANGDVYIRMASKLYKVPEETLLRLVKVEEDKKAIGQRKFAKDIVLGCGYQMGGPGFHNNCLMRGIVVDLDDCKEAVRVYRKEHPNIVKLWSDVERCANQAVLQDRSIDRAIKLRNLSFYVEHTERMNWFCIKLPNGRVLRYCQPKSERVERFGKQVDKLSYRTEVKGMWVRESTYGGKLVENITQAVARDIMVESMVKAERRGYETIGTVHDELIAEVDEDFGSHHELEEIMRIKPTWCSDAPINAEGWQGPRYRK